MGRILGPAEYGRYGLVVTLTTMVVVLIGQGVPTAMAKYLGEIYDTKLGLIPIIKRQTAKIQFILIGGMTMIFFLLSPVIALVLRDPSLTNLFQVVLSCHPRFCSGFVLFLLLHRPASIQNSGLAQNIPVGCPTRFHSGTGFAFEIERSTRLKERLSAIFSLPFRYSLKPIFLISSKK